ncbi:hypothetical protein JHK84_027814 [Glycine max]|nr:hypothetical protein JHK84_027814 [Glycine max]
MAGDEGVIRKQGQQSHSDRQQQIEAKLDQVDTFAKGGGGRGKESIPSKMTQWCQLGHRESLDRRRQLDGHPIFVHFLKVRHLAKHNKTSSQTFNRFCKGHVLIDDDTSYNVLISKSLLNALGIIVSMPHLAMKFPNHKGKIVTIKVDQVEARECYAKSYSSSPTHLPL